MDIEAKNLVRSAQPGQFLIVKTMREGERIPLTICVAIIGSKQQ